MSDYNQFVLLAAYYAIEQSPGDPDVISDWSRQLYKDFNGCIEKYGTLARVPLNPDDRTVMATMAYLSPPSGVPEEQAKNAVAAYREHLGV